MSAQPAQRRSARIVLLGFGAINRRVAALLRSRGTAAEIVGVIRRQAGRSSADFPEGAALIDTPEQLTAIAPDFVLEAASREAVQTWGTIGLRVARRLIVSSTSAFVDDQLLDQLKETAARHGSQLVLSPGALAGVDALSAAARIPIREVRHRIVKPPQSWGSVAAEMPPSGSTAASVLYRGSARECARRYPLNANVTVVSALSGVGLDATIVELVSDPTATANRHELLASGDFGTLSVTLENRPLRSNPKSSELAALALVRWVENQVSDVVI